MATKPAPNVILLDSCSYFRLGFSLHPLLCRLEGNPEYVLKVLADLDYEYNKSPRLWTKFWWVRQKELVKERAENSYSLHGKKVLQADLSFSYLKQYAADNSLSVSPIDMRVLCAGLVSNGFVVTDDVAMQTLANVFNIGCLSTLDLLQLLYERGKITTSEIDNMLTYWSYDLDVPTSYPAIMEWRQELGRSAP